ncbi:transport protein Avl9-domain-containing protein [Radiomyces spectabilis]|uniref:transport protein Avl9-domain-containing protein n=1 Tax=Radiomyces spectabilis TaxID=64574 RepID=UPI002220517A|nr:transport protein Avl9-domain-containing protein [Radiomyces spectabilis]KAI8365945.1 transport protein Avl9-domain-containing protein [Radiomyces spectabilis]
MGKPDPASTYPVTDPSSADSVNKRRTSLDQNVDQQIAAILVVGFHHAYGPIVEFCVPPLPSQHQNTAMAAAAEADTTKRQGTLEKLELPEEWSILPFLALPDGAHQKDEDFAYFHLPPVPGWSVAETTLFGISCNRQIATKDLLVKTPDITRSIVQKAVVVLARQPVFGPLRQKLAVITAAWFNQKDFTQIGILYNLYNNLNTKFCGPIDDPTLYMGTSLRELLFKFKSKTLILLKLLLLERKILFYGYPVERLCTFQYSLISLIPGLMRSLRDSGAPHLESSIASLKKTEARELTSGRKDSLLRYMGLPLRLFEKGSFFQPYLPLQQIDMLSSKETKSYLVGTTNQIFFHHKSDVDFDVLVNVENGTIEYYNQRLSSIVSPTMADRRWTEKILRVLNDTWDQNDPSRPMQNTYLGSDDYLRACFEEYVLSLLSSMKHAQDSNLLPTSEQHDTISEDFMRGEDKERNYLNDYGIIWLMAWRETQNFKLWDRYTDHEIYEIVEPGHPGMGNLSLMDIQNTISNRLQDFQLRQNLAPLRHTLSKAMSGGVKAVSTGRSRLMRGVDALFNEFERNVHDEPHSSRSSDSPQSEAGPSKSKAAYATDARAEQSFGSPTAETTTQQAGRLFSNFSSFLSRKGKEISQAMEEASISSSPKDAPSVKREGSRKKEPSHVSDNMTEDDNGSAFVDVGAMYSFPPSGPFATPATTGKKRDANEDVNAKAPADTQEHEEQHIKENQVIDI